MGLKKLLVLGIALFLLPISSMASHVFGGQIYWKRQVNGQFKFYLELHADVGTGAASLPTTATLTTNSGASITLQSITNFSYPGSCGTSTYSLGKRVYESAAITLAGTPPATGWDFTYSTCCKSNGIVNLSSPGSSSIEIRTTMFAGALAQKANGDYPETPILIGIGEVIMTNNGSRSIPTLVYQPYGDSIHTEFEALSVGGVNASYAAGFSGTQPLPGLNQGALFDPVIQNNILTVSPNTLGAFSTGIKAETYIGGALIAVQHIDLLVDINPASSPFNSAPNIAITSSSHILTTLPANPLTGDSSAVSLTAQANDTINFAISVTDTAGDPTPLSYFVNSQTPGLVQIDSMGTGLYLVKVFTSLEPSLSSGMGGSLKLNLISQDGGCPIAGIGVQKIDINVASTPLNTQVGICMVAADTSTLKHFVYIDAPENANGSSLALIWREYDVNTGIWSNDTAFLPDSDTIYEHSINSNLPTVAYYLEYYDALTGMAASNDDLQVGNLPLSAVNAGYWNQITLPYASSTPLLWIKLFRKPFGAPASSYVEVDSMYQPIALSGIINLYDSIPTMGVYDYSVEAMVDYSCDTTQMNLKNWWYYTTLTSAEEVSAYVSLTEIKNTPFAVYPNPTSGIIYLDSKEVKSITVWSTTGQKLKITYGSNQINVMDLTAGVYLLKIETNNGEHYSTRIQKY